MWVAPNSLAHASLRSSMSTATIVDAPASAEPAIAASPTPPQPNTATVLPRVTLPVLMRRAEPGHHAAAEQPGGGRRRLRVDLRALAGGDERLLDERPDAERRRQLGAVGQRHLLGRVVGGEAVPRLAAQARPALPAHGPPVEDDVVAGRDVGDARADGLDGAGGLVAEQERELVVDPALAVVQVGVAHAARLDLRRRPRPGPGRGSRSSRCVTGSPLARATTPRTSCGMAGERSRSVRRNWPDRAGPEDRSVRTAGGRRAPGRAARRSRPRPSGSPAPRRAPGPGA